MDFEDIEAFSKVEGKSYTEVPQLKITKNDLNEEERQTFVLQCQPTN
jgi:hypothetical protein